MDKTLISRASIFIIVPPSKVWQALTDPEMIRQYLFGTTVVCDWKVNSPIIYRGQWQGKKYQDKGTVVDIVPEKLLVTTYWSSMSGLLDTPENYKKVSYELIAENGGTTLTIIQDNNKTEDEKKHTEDNWKMVLASLKKLLEQE